GHEPVDPYIDLENRESKNIYALIEIMGGHQDVILENLRLEGQESEQGRDFFEKVNVSYPTHIMPGMPGVGWGIGNLTIKNIDVISMESGPAVMRYNKSTILIDDVRMKNLAYGMWVWNCTDSDIQIINNDVSLNPDWSWHGIHFLRVNKGLVVRGNKVAGSRGTAINLAWTNEAIIEKNIIQDHHSFAWGYAVRIFNYSTNNYVAENKFKNLDGEGGGILIAGGAHSNTVEFNDFIFSQLPGWSDSSPNGPGAVLIDINSHSNKIFEVKFPYGRNISICNMIWDKSDDPVTPEYDGLNEIHHWLPCEKLPEREAHVFGEDIKAEALMGDQ
ncbi:MAG: right-handed parallel beta-helix repeat-containing protein, partial [Cyclobacteriaceae bacterium]|nr:right-handed parallel beta-helix repeat-containing protein [Cyclobacteriaceae bacterium]